MNLQPVKEPPGFVAQCLTCKQWIPAGTAKIADLDGEPFKAYYHTTCRPHVYTCSDPVCAARSGTYTTTIQPHTFPSCTWCGKLLQVKV